MTRRAYRYRYLVEPGEWIAPEGGLKVRSNVTVTSDNYGYTDDLILVSILDTEDGGKNLLMLSTQDQGPPSRKTLLELQTLIAASLETLTRSN